MTLVTGAAGFIGDHLAARNLDLGRPVAGLDNPDNLAHDVGFAPRPSIEEEGGRVVRWYSDQDRAGGPARATGGR